MILVILTLVSTAVGTLATLNLLGWKKRKLSLHPRLPSISIIKPIRGVERDQERNLESFFKLNKAIPYELLLSVKNPEDPCLVTIDKIVKKYPLVDCRVLINTPDIGRNPKINNLHQAWRVAKHDLIFLSDSNVYAEPDYLEFMLAERQNGAGVVSQVIYGSGAYHLAGHLDSVHCNTFYNKATSLLDLLGFPVILGKSIMVSRSEFEKAYGMYNMRKYLADDYIMGIKMMEAGYRAVVCKQLQKQTPVVKNLRAYWKRHVRWVGTRRVHNPAAVFLEPLIFETIWPLLLFAFSNSIFGISVASACLAIQITNNILIHYFKIKDPNSWESFKWFWLKDLLYPFIWVAGLFSNSITWENTKLYLRPDGKLGSKYYKAAARRTRLRKLKTALLKLCF